MVEVMKIMAIFLKRSQECTATVHVFNPATGHHWPMPPPETPRLPQASLLCSDCSFLLGPRAQGATVSSEPISQSYVSPGSSMVGLMVTSSKRAYAVPGSAAPEPLPLQQSTADPYLHRRHSHTVLSQCLWVSGSWCTQVIRWQQWKFTGKRQRNGFDKPLFFRGGQAFLTWKCAGVCGSFVLCMKKALIFLVIMLICYLVPTLQNSESFILQHWKGA